ncbi:hypothetical protein [Tenacibaculum sp.]|uniref:hypothetical protein n=1 Tax=Tenacibaculum sp. TaxID=1906242 RepID=UPI003D09DED1
MKRLILVLCLTAFARVNAQDKSNSKIEKDAKGISINAPEGVHQYAFRIGEWESTSKGIQRNGSWKTGLGQYRVFVADNGLTFIEEGLDKEGNVTHTITFDYIEATDSWENNYIDRTGRKVKYSSKVVDGNMVETIVRENNTNNNTYTVLADNIYIYTARRTFNNGYILVNHVGISTKKISN